jgi:hypothetical protein
MQRDTFEKLEEFLPKEMRGRWVIAGGYAADSTRAGDIDMFVLAPRFLREDLAYERDVVHDYLEERGIPYVPSPGGEGYGAMRLLAATIEKGYEGKDVQIIVTSFTRVEALVESFDLSVHAIAKRAKGDGVQVTFGRQWTTPSEPIQVLRWDTPEDTLRRLTRLVARYNTRANVVDMLKLEARLQKAA